MTTTTPLAVRPAPALTPVPWTSIAPPDPPGPTDHVDPLLMLLGMTAPGDVGRAALRARAIERYLPLAASVARRFSGRGEPLADLTQVAVVGLIKAVDRFDSARGTAFASFALPTMLGEIKRHFRDTVWIVRVPRATQELKLRLGSATEDLAHALHRQPTAVEMAVRLGVSAQELAEARRSSSAYRPLSLESPVHDGEELRLGNTLGALETGIEAVDRRETLRAGLAGLPERERYILNLRFVCDMTQTQIAAEVGLSQMQISRLLSRSLARLRAGLPPAAVGAALPPPRPRSGGSSRRGH